jgi:hypothetical protein
VVGGLFMGTVIALTVLAVGGWAIQLGRRRRGAAVSTRLAVVITLLAVDGWLWAAAGDAAFGPIRWLVGPLVLVNAVLAMGAIYGLTGFQAHKDFARGAAARAGALLGHDESTRAIGRDDDPRFH